MNKSLISAPLLCFASSAALANPAIESKDHIYVGVFDQNSTSTLEAARDGRDPVRLTFEELGIDDKDTSYMLEYKHRFDNRWSLSLAAYEFQDNDEVTALRDFNYDGVDFTAGIQVKSAVNIDTYIIDGMYEVYHTPNTQIAVGAGLHVFDIETSLEARAGIVDGVQVQSERASAAVTAPLPNLRASMIHAFGDKFSVNATLGWLSAYVDNYEGGFKYLHLRGQYQLTDHWGVTAGYQFVQVDLQENLENGHNRFDTEFKGVTAAVTYSF